MANKTVEHPLSGTLRTLISGGINWDWYLQGDFNEAERTVHILFHDRWHRYENRGSGHPVHERTSFEILEDRQRIAYGVKVGGVEYLVTNPAQVFSYADMTNYVAESL
jgi:hypothetical protein